ncbi:MAG: AraC family transcriptional regulator [Eubacterium sp.]|nr:AraC family transcriptional regulator [Eubacterium sp.]MBQ9061597.1 AraC family transcriptional regulator [Eubacterium sp.]MBR0398020.1 AraC family transcriptional regulator [Eubacterium sp.]
MDPNPNIQYLCSYVTEFSWLTADISILNFASMGDFLINLPHEHPFRELLYLESGTLQVQICGDTFEMQKGDLLYINSQIPHIVSSAGDDPPITYNTSFLLSHRANIEKIPSAWTDDETSLIRPLLDQDYLYAHDTAACGEQIQAIKEAIALHRRGDFVRVRNHISNLFIGALQSFTRLAPDPRYHETITGEYSYNASKILLYLHEHFTEGLTLASVAEALHYSPRQCQRLIQESMGISFSELLQDLQLSYAKTLLRTTDESLETVSERSGFSNSRNFYHHFKQHESVSPSQYRKLYRLRNCTEA